MPERTSTSLTISVEETRKLLQSDPSVVLLDVRTAEEWKSATGHLPNARLLPIQELDSRIRELEPMRSRTIVVYCRSGGRSLRAAKLLSEKGFRAMSMDGGMLKWNAQELPVVRENKP